MGRLPLSRLSRRRQGPPACPRPESRSRATSPSWSSCCAASRAKRFVLDGEIVVPKDGELSFDELLLRIHPAASRITKLATESPASLIVFDLLVDATGKSLVALPLAERRAALERSSPRSTRVVAREALARHDETCHGEAVVPLRGRRARRRHRQAARPALPVGHARRHAEDEVACAPPSVSSAGSATRRRGRSSARCCSDCTTTAGCCTTSASRSNIPNDQKPALTKKLEVAREAAGVHRPGARRPEPLEHGSARPNGSRSRTSSSSRCSTITSPADASATAPVPALASRQAAAPLHDRAGGAGRALRDEAALAVAPPFAPTGRPRPSALSRGRAAPGRSRPRSADADGRSSTAR